jgi:hypothetical protein
MLGRMPSPVRSLPPRRFRRRLLLALVLVGLLPPLAGGLALHSLLDRMLAMSPPVAALLDRASAALERSGGDPGTVAELRLAELNLAQADLLRRQLMVQFAPMEIKSAYSQVALDMARIDLECLPQSFFCKLRGTFLYVDVSQKVVGQSIFWILFNRLEAKRQRFIQACLLEGCFDSPQISRPARLPCTALVPCEKDSQEQEATD